MQKFSEELVREQNLEQHDWGTVVSHVKRVSLAEELLKRMMRMRDISRQHKCASFLFKDLTITKLPRCEEQTDVQDYFDHAV